MYFSQMSEPLQHLFPELRKANKRTKYLPAKCLSATDRHRDDSEAYVFTDTYFRTLRHNPTHARQLLTNLGLFVFSEDYSWVDEKDDKKDKNDPRRVAKKAYPTQLFHDFNDWLGDTKFELWDAVQNKKASAAPEVITVDGVRIEGNPSINLNNLKHFIQSGYKQAHKKDGPRRDFTLWRSRARTMWRLATAPNARPGCLPQSFKLNDRTHRIQSTSACVQNCHELLRDAMFDGYYDVDIANCHFATLAQLHPSPTLSLYAEQPDMVRQKIADDIGASPKAVKTSLLAMLYGGQPGGEGITGIQKYLGSGTQSEFWRHDLTDALRKDIKTARAALGFDNDAAFSCYLMQKEQRIIRAMARDLIICVPMHDGFLIPEPVDTQLLEKEVEKETGYSITITQKRAAYEFPRSTTKG